MKKIVYTLILISLLFACNQEEENVKHPLESKPYTSQQIDDIITNSLKQHNEFKWSDVSPEVVSSALAEGDSMLVVGYKPESVKDIDSKLADLNIHTPEWQIAKAQTLAKIMAVVRRNSPTHKNVEDVLVLEDETLPFFIVKIADVEVIKLLRSLKTLRYAEPMGYPFEKSKPNVNSRILSGSGCGNDPENSIPIEDFINITPNGKVSWSLPYMNIPAAWQYSTGKGIKVAIIDTGLSPEQINLGSSFNIGESIGRQVEKYGTFKSSIWPWSSIDGPDDKCGHGTQMAGAATAPRGTNGSAVGVAYNANLMTIRGTGDVVLESSNEIKGVVDALKLAANKEDLRIISMSIGTPLTSSSLGDAIRYAYGKGKLIFCAAGTSFSYTTWVGVIFPARMDEVQAVTGIYEGTSYKVCDNCHSGEQVDFTVAMQRNGGKNFPLTLAFQGDVPSRVGGSSVATSLTAGIAALTWSTNPQMSREEVVSRLQRAGQLYPYRLSDFGWGTIDALKAVTGNY